MSNERAAINCLDAASAMLAGNLELCTYARALAHDTNVRWLLIGLLFRQRNEAGEVPTISIHKRDVARILDFHVVFSMLRFTPEIACEVLLKQVSDHLSQLPVHRGMIVYAVSIVHGSARKTFTKLRAQHGVAAATPSMPPQHHSGLVLPSAYDSKRQCHVCTLMSASQICSACLCIAYCSGACQRADWATHRPVCRRLAPS